jgi:hypothetical protein
MGVAFLTHSLHLANHLAYALEGVERMKRCARYKQWKFEEDFNFTIESARTRSRKIRSSKPGVTTYKSSR